MLVAQALPAHNRMFGTTFSWCLQSDSFRVHVSCSRAIFSLLRSWLDSQWLISYILMTQSSKKNGIMQSLKAWLRLLLSTGQNISFSRSRPESCLELFRTCHYNLLRSTTRRASLKRSQRRKKRKRRKRSQRRTIHRHSAAFSQRSVIMICSGKHSGSHSSWLQISLLRMGRPGCLWMPLE